MRPSGSTPIGKRTGEFHGGFGARARSAPLVPQRRPRLPSAWRGTRPSPTAVVSHSRSGAVSTASSSISRSIARRGDTGATIAARGLADDVIQRLVMDVIEPRAVVDAVDGTRVATPDELVEEGVALRPVRDAGEARVLTRDADAGVPHDEHEEARLTLREAEFDDGLNAFVRSSSVPELLGQAAVATAAPARRRSGRRCAGSSRDNTRSPTAPRWRRARRDSAA